MNKRITTFSVFLIVVVVVGVFAAQAGYVFGPGRAGGDTFEQIKEMCAARESGDTVAYGERARDISRSFVSKVASEVPTSHPSIVTSEVSSEVPTRETSEVPSEVSSKVVSDDGTVSTVTSVVNSKVASDTTSTVTSEVSSEVISDTTSTVVSLVPKEKRVKRYCDWVERKERRRR